MILNISLIRIMAFGKFDIQLIDLLVDALLRQRSEPSSTVSPLSFVLGYHLVVFAVNQPQYLFEPEPSC